VTSTSPSGERRRSSTSASRATCSVRCGALLLLLLVLLLPAQGLADDPFKALDLIRPSRPMAASDFVVPGLSSPPLRLSDFRGKVVFLNFWATWCLPCKEEMPAMERLYQRDKQKGLEILAISLDTQSAAAVQRFVTELKLTYPIGLDPKWAVAEKYTVRALPSSFLIDRKGSVVAIALGPRDWDGPAAHAVMESLLRER